MARDNMELCAWGDGTIRLAYWDTSEGKDRIFILGEDGRTYVEDDDDNRTPVDMIAELRTMALAWRAQAREGRE
jgi:hypothetical protein